MHEIAAKLAESTAQLTAPGAPYELEDAEINGYPCRQFRNVPANVRELLAVGRQHGDKVFLVYEGEEWSFNRFFAQVDAIGARLASEFGVGKGDRVAIAMRNYPEWMTAYVAIVSMGAVAVPLNSWGKRDELEYGLTDSGARIVFCDPPRLDHIAADLGTLGVRAIVARSNGAALPEGAISLESLLEGSEGATLPAFDVAPDDAAMIMYTSGTTGRPKGALSTQRNVVQAIHGFEFGAMLMAMNNQKAIEHMLTSGNEPSSLLAVPLFHVSGCYAQFLLSLRGGRKIVMMYKWDPTQALKLIEKHRITSFSGAPAMVMDVLDHPEFDNHDTSALFSVGGGGAACPPRYSKLVYEKIPMAYPGAGYGMTETNAICSSFTGEPYRYKPRASGYLVPIMELKTVDENGRDLPPGETGEIWVRGPTVIQGYWNRPDANAETFHDGWLATGDIGHLDEEGFVFIVDRAKDIVIRGGENISSGEVEGVLSWHPAVQEAAAFGVPHDTLGEELAVAVTLRPGQSTDAEGIRAFVGEHLAGFKVPAYVWIRDEALPRNATGKIVKKTIREEYLARQS